MTETSPSLPPEHAEQYVQLSRNVQRLAQGLISTHPDFGAEFVAKAFLGVAATILERIWSRPAAAATLREMADSMEAPGEQAN